MAIGGLILNRNFDSFIGSSTKMRGSLIMKMTVRRGQLDDRVEVVSDLGRLQGSYVPRNATLKNRGHDIMLKWEADA
ncbi:unnamed protein product [Prunus armeniaca]